jgi:hypothetical protein
MEPSELIQMLRDKSTPSESASTTNERISIIKQFLEEREEIYLHRKPRPPWIPVGHRVTMTDKKDETPPNYYNKLRNSWGADSLTIQPLNLTDWKPAFTYYRKKVDSIPIPRPFRKGIYSLYLAELGHYFIKELKERILKQHESIITHEYKMIHKESQESRTKKILIKTGNYVDAMKVSFGFKKITLTVEHQRHEESRDITYLQLSRILEFGTTTSPPYSHWRKLKNIFDGGESKSFMKSFLYMYLDVPKKKR